jgi:peptidoglycan/LPS O-acetylase OafA/YrhL
MNSTNNIKRNNVDRSFGLDVCRTLAILLVVLGHALQHSEPLPILKEMGMIGLFGVDLFFCLSGFLIGRILFAESTNWPIGHESGLFNFWYRRWMRTLPLYFFYLFVSLKYDWRGETTLYAQRAYLLFAQNLMWPMPDFFHLAWSLAVEEWFYLMFPLVLLFIIGLGQHNRRAAVITIGIFILVPFLFRAYLPSHIVGLNGINEGLRHVVVFRLDAIGFGMLMAYLYVWKRAWFDELAKYWVGGAPGQSHEADGQYNLTSRVESYLVADFFASDRDEWRTKGSSRCWSTLPIWKTRVHGNHRTV